MSRALLFMVVLAIANEAACKPFQGIVDQIPNLDFIRQLIRTGLQAFNTFSGGFLGQGFANDKFLGPFGALIPKAPQTDLLNGLNFSGKFSEQFGALIPKTPQTGVISSLNFSDKFSEQFGALIPKAPQTDLLSGLNFSDKIPEKFGALIPKAPHTGLLKNLNFSGGDLIKPSSSKKLLSPLTSLIGQTGP